MLDVEVSQVLGAYRFFRLFLQCLGPRGCYMCDEFDHLTKDCPRHALASF